MRYGRLTLEVVFSHDDNVPAPVAAMRIARDALRGDVIGISGVNLEPMTEREVVQAAGGCGECDDCQVTIDEMIMPGCSHVEPNTAEDAAIERAQGA
jgi:hypothetical protein